MNNFFWQGFEKTALNAFKARQMAKGFGLLPDGAWKWGLRNLRKGKTPQQLGMAPQKMIDSARRLGGDHTEVGALWGKGVKGGEGKLRLGDAGSVNIYGKNYNKMLASVSKKYEKYSGRDVTSREFLRLEGKMQGDLKRGMKPFSNKNTIHTHPEKTRASGAVQEKQYLNWMRDPEHLKNIDQDARLTFPDPAVAKRVASRNKRSSRALADSIEKRYQSSDFMLMPSGFRSNIPHDRNAADINVFLGHNVGTHHNIATTSGVGVHTVRPDKSVKGGKRLRTLLFKDNAPQAGPTPSPSVNQAYNLTPQRKIV